MTRTFDVVIVGGGVYGSALAWELSRRDASVVLLEADRIASGASGGPGKRGVRASSRDERELPLSRLANDIWPALERDLGASIGYQRIGGLELFELESTRKRAAAQVELQQRHGIESRIVECDELREMEPGLSSRMLGAVFCPHDGVVDHTATTLAYAAAARRASGEVLEKTPVRALQRADRAVTVVTDDDRFVAARDVVLLANFAAVDLLAPLHIELPVGRVFPQIVITKPVPDLDVRHLVGHLERRAIIKQLADGSAMISGGWLGRWDGATQRGETVAEYVEQNFAEACAVFPVLRDAGVREAHADRAEAVGPQLLPVIDRVSGIDNLVAGTGWSGHGFAIAPAVARLMAAWLLDGAKPPELEPFAWRTS